MKGIIDVLWEEVKDKFKKENPNLSEQDFINAWCLYQLKLIEKSKEEV